MKLIGALSAEEMQNRQKAAAERLAVVQGVELLEVGDTAKALTKTLLARLAVSASQPRDALHIAIATVRGVQFIVTWNFKHIANVITRGVIEETCRKFGYEPPRICTPDELLEV